MSSRKLKLLQKVPALRLHADMPHSRIIRFYDLLIEGKKTGITLGVDDDGEIHMMTSHMKHFRTIGKAKDYDGWQQNLEAERKMPTDEKELSVLSDAIDDIEQELADLKTNLELTDLIDDLDTLEKRFAKLESYVYSCSHCKAVENEDEKRKCPSCGKLI